MDSTPPPSSRSEPRPKSKSASKNREFGQENSILPFSSSPSPKPPNLSLNNSLPIRELLLLSPSLATPSKTRLSKMSEELALDLAPPRRKCKTRGSPQMGGSPRNSRRLRRRDEKESEEIARTRKRRNSGKNDNQLKLLPPNPKSINVEGNLDRIGEMLKELLMWKDVAKTSLWFGLGSLFFLSSWFSKGVTFSLVSTISQLGLLLLGLSFLSNTFRRVKIEEHDYKLNEEFILKVARLLLPATNLAISITRKLFSGDPSMTLKVAPFFLMGAQYGHLITLRKLCAIGFFGSFTIPKLYSSYFTQIEEQGEYLKLWVLNAWGACSYKKLVASSILTLFWNISTVKTRIFAAFMGLVLFRYQFGQVLENEMEEEQKVQGG